MSNKKKQEKVTERLSIRVSKKEKQGIIALAKRRGMTISDYIICKVLRKTKR